MEIRYWDCKFSEYEVRFPDADGEESRFYGCSHKNSPDGCCHLENKWSGDEDDCKLIDGKDFEAHIESLQRAPAKGE